MGKLVGWLLGAALLWVLWPTGFVEGAPLTQGATLIQHGASQGGHPGSREPSQPAGSSWAESANPQEVPKPRRNPRPSPRRKKPWAGRAPRRKAPKPPVTNPQDGESLSQTITKKVGSAPILKHFIQRMGVVAIIDELVPSHPGREISHGEAVAGLMVYLLNDGRALYRVEGWAEETSILSQLFPGYRPEDWTDDRLGDTLDALYQKGLELIQGSISAHLVVEFGVGLEEIHYDTTSVSLWGTYDPAVGKPAVVITLGYSKDHRPDLKQVVVGMAVSGDGGVPLLSKTEDGLGLRQQPAPVLLGAAAAAGRQELLLLHRGLQDSHLEDLAGDLCAGGAVSGSPGHDGEPTGGVGREVEGGEADLYNRNPGGRRPKAHLPEAEQPAGHPSQEASTGSAARGRGRGRGRRTPGDGRP